jgi:hypothetical protein
MAKLSREAAKQKAVRDKKAAMTPARRKKKAENQRKRRAAANKHGKSWLNGKDYDHDDKRFESIKANRGNDGNGTKKESNKNTRKTKHMAKKKKSPLYGVPLGFSGVRAPRFSVKKYMEAAPGTKFAAATSGDSSMPKTSGPKELRPGGGVRRSTITSEGYKIPGTSDNKRPEYKIPGTGSSTVKSKNTTTKPKSSTSTKAKSVAKPISSSDSGDRSGGYLKDTRNFSLGVDLSMPRSKMQTTVYNARSADNNLIGGRLSRRGKIAARQVAKTSRVKERVGNRIEKIKGKQVRAGVKAGEKLARRDKGIDPGYFESQKKLDAFEKPKAAKPSMKLKPTMSKTQTLTDSQLNKKLNKPAVKKKTTGKTKSLSMTRGERQQSLTDLAMGK